MTVARVAPCDVWEAQVSWVLADVLGREINPTDNFFDVGGDSATALRVIAQLESRYAVGIPVAAFYKDATAAGIASYARAWRREPGLVVTVRGDGDRRPIFALHHVGGDVLPYFALLRSLPDQPSFAIQSPELERLGAAPRTVPTLASLYVSLIRGIQPTGPYALLGWSFGGCLAWECACQLRKAGESVDLLALLEAYVPRGRKAGPFADECEFMDWWYGDYLGVLRRRAVNLRDIEPNERARILAMELASVLPRYAHLPGLPPERARSYLLAPWAHFEAAWAYTPGCYDGPVLLISARDSPQHHAASAQHGWEEYATAIESREVPGTHSSMLRAPQVAAVASALEQYLNASERCGMPAG